MNAIDACYHVLLQAKTPLRYEEITNRILEDKLWPTDGKTPHRTIYSKLAMDIKNYGAKSRFVRTAPSTFGLREWSLIDFNDGEVFTPEELETEKQKYSFTDAAEIVLDTLADKNPMHYNDIADRILELELVNTQGKTPEATLYSMILSEINRNEKRGKNSRFVKYGQGIFGLRKWLGEGLAYQIERQNQSVKKELFARIQTLTPQAFELLIGRLLTKMNFVDVEVTKLSGDGGIDVRGTLVVGDVIRTKMAIQAKKWKNNVQSPVVQQVRGSLGAHEQGMIITTSDFSKGAVGEAARTDAVPVALVNGQQLVELLIEHQIMVKRLPYELITLDDE